MKRALVFACLLAGCATTPEGRAYQAGLTAKAFVDGVGTGYLTGCREIRRPRCIQADKDAAEAGTPLSEADRVACLRPCDSKTASAVQNAVGVVRAFQLGLFRVLATGADKDAIEQAEADLRAAVLALVRLLDDTGATDVASEGARNG